MSAAATARAFLPPVELTPNEYRVARAAAMGLSNKEIAGDRNTAKTIEYVLDIVLQKLGIHRRSDLTFIGLRLGWFTVDEVCVPDVRVVVKGGVQ